MADDADGLYAQAVALVIETRNGSTAHLQRRLQIGFNHAADLMERMESEGVVGPRNHAGKREVLTAPGGISTITITTAAGSVTATPETIKEAMSQLGHNSGRAPRAPPRDTGGDASTIDVLNATAQTQLRAILERIERLEEDKAAVMADLKEVYAEAKGNGFDAKIIRKVVRIRKMDRAKRQEEDALIDLYLSAIGEV